MKPHARQRRGVQLVGLWGVLLAASALLLSVSGVGAQGHQLQVGILTAGPIAAPALEGLREGLAQLGYHEGKDIAYTVENAAGELASIANQAMKIAAAKPHVIFAVGTTPTATAKQATTIVPIVFTLVADPRSFRRGGCESCPGDRCPSRKRRSPG
jgi:putative tryptophan/tyrosine transport system substrate-binding protein